MLIKKIQLKQLIGQFMHVLEVLKYSLNNRSQYF